MTKFVLGVDTKREADKMAMAMIKISEKWPGYIKATVLADYANGEYTWISYWDTKEDCYDSSQPFLTLLRDILGHKFQWEPAIQIFEVHEPRKFEL